MDDPREEDAEAVALIIGRGAVEAMRSQDFDLLRAWVAREMPTALPRLHAAGENEPGLRAVANAIATTIWNASPLPSNGYRPRPRPVPSRNDACPCGSGQKFKRCCGSVSPGFPAVPEEETWVLLAGHLTSDERKRIAGDPALPPKPLAVLALEMRERGESDGARAALAPRLERVEELDDRFEPALDVFLDLESDAREMDEFVRLGLGLAARLSPRLQATVFRHLVPAAIDAREMGLASELLDRIRTATPDDPTIAPLEVTMLLAAGETPRASERARFWLSWLRRRGFAEEMPEAVDLLERTARDPEAAAEEFRAEEIPFLSDLATILAGAPARPVRPYRLDVVAGEGAFARPPRGVREAELAWHRVWTGPKPGLVSFDVDLPDSLIHEPGPWLDLLHAHPEALDSLDVLDSLVFLAGPATEELDPGWDRTLLAPLLDRSAAIVRASVAAAEGLVRLPWAFLENRPALRLLSRLGHRLDGLGRAGEAAAVYEEILRLNPNDNHGHRTWLINYALRKGDDARALALADQYPDDALVDILFGRGLALWRLGRRPEAEQALGAAAEYRLNVVEALVAPHLPEPTLTPGLVTLGGEDEAWIYREDMRDVWESTPEALDYLRGLPKAGPVRGGRRKRRPPRER